MQYRATAVYRAFRFLTLLATGIVLYSILRGCHSITPDCTEEQRSYCIAWPDSLQHDRLLYFFLVTLNVAPLIREYQFNCFFFFLTAGRQFEDNMILS